MILDIKGRIIFDSKKQLNKIFRQIEKFNGKMVKVAVDGGINCSNSKNINKWIKEHENK